MKALSLFNKTRGLLMLTRPACLNINMSGVEFRGQFATPTLTLGPRYGGGPGLRKIDRHPARTGTAHQRSQDPRGRRKAAMIPTMANRTQGQDAISTNRVAGPLLPPVRLVPCAGVRPAGVGTGIDALDRQLPGVITSSSPLAEQSQWRWTRPTCATTLD
jgi:hypothetical protein